MTTQSPILKDAVASNRTNKKIKFIVGGVVIVALIGYLIVSSISSEGAYFREVGEVLDQQTAADRQKPARQRQGCHRERRV